MDMRFRLSNRGGKDDDQQPPHQNRFSRESLAAARFRNDMERQIHELELQACRSVLRAFLAQADSISWERGDFIMTLREELKVSSDEYHDLLRSVRAEDMIVKISEQRSTNVFESGMIGASQPLQHDIPIPTIPASSGKPQPSQSAENLSVKRAPHATNPSVLKSSSANIQGHPRASMQYHSTDIAAQPPATNLCMGGAHSSREPAVVRGGNHYNGRKVLIRWDEDKQFYEARISGYDPVKDVHSVFYMDEEKLDYLNVEKADCTCNAPSILCSLPATSKNLRINLSSSESLLLTSRYPLLSMQNVSCNLFAVRQIIL